MKIFILLLGATLIELYLIITVGEIIGAFSTIVVIVLTAIIGSFLLKQQGRNTLTRAQQSLLQGQMPAQEMIEGVVLMISGVLLLTPGFLTDIVGLLGLMPWSRVLFVQYLIVKKSHRFMNRFTQQTTQQASQNNPFQQNPKSQQPNTLEGEFWEDK